MGNKIKGEMSGINRRTVARYEWTGLKERRK